MYTQENVYEAGYLKCVNEKVSGTCVRVSVCVYVSIVCLDQQQLYVINILLLCY